MNILLPNRLGLKLDEHLAELDAEAGLPPAIAARWAATEAERSARQWRPLRAGGGDADGGGGSLGEGAGSDDSAADAAAKERAVRFSDLEDSLFTRAFALSLPGSDIRNNL